MDFLLYSITVVNYVNKLYLDSWHKPTLEGHDVLNEFCKLLNLTCVCLIFMSLFLSDIGLLYIYFVILCFRFQRKAGLIKLVGKRSLFLYFLKSLCRKSNLF